MIVAILPARGGSKRIPRKNVRGFCGKPMIAWPIQVARASGIFDHIVVSTDDPEIMSVATEAGAEVPFTRPAELSDDHTTTLPVIRHAVGSLKQQGWPVEFVCCIYPTTPFLSAEFLKAGLDKLQQNPALNFVFPVAKFESSIFRALRLGENDVVSMFWREHELTRTQDLPQAYYDVGQFYWGTADSWCSQERIYSSQAGAIVLPSHLVQDIDTPEDWQRAELMMKQMTA